MIEPIMFFGIGFLVASLLGLVLIPLVHNRAVRLTMRRLEAATPLSMAEIQADKDQLRAEFAMSTRRLELSVEQMKTKTTSQLAELGKKTDAINRLKVELGEKTAAIFALEAREKALRDQLHATEGEHSVKIGSLREAERMLADKEAELAKLAADLDERSVARRQPAHRDRRAAHAGRGAEGSRHRPTRSEAQEIEDRLDRERKDATAATQRARRGARQGREARRPRRRSSSARWWRRPPRPKSSAAACRSSRRGWPNRCASSPSASSNSTRLRDKVTAAQKTETDLRAETRLGREPPPHRDRKPAQRKDARSKSSSPARRRPKASCRTRSRR